MIGADGLTGALFEAFEEASRRSGLVERTYSVAGHGLRLRFAGGELASQLTPSFAHLAAPPNGDCLTIHIWDEQSSGVPLPPAIRELGPEPGDAGSRPKIAYAPADAAVSMLAREARAAFYWLEGPPCHWVRVAPLRTLLHWWLAPHGIHLAHGGVVGTDRGGVFLAGHGGAGKSTTALACLLAGMDYVGDDYVLVSTDPEPTAFSTYCSAKLTDESLGLLPELRSLIAIPKNGDDKSVLILHPALEKRLRTMLSLRALILPVLSDRPRPRLVPASAGAAGRALAVSSAFLFPSGAADATFKATSDLVRKLPLYTLELGSDPRDSAREIALLIEAGDG